MTAADGVRERRHQGDAQAETNAHRPLPPGSEVRGHFCYLDQGVAQALSPNMACGDLENKILTQFCQASVEQLVLLTGEVVPGLIWQPTFQSQAAGTFTRVRVTQDGQHILAAPGDKVDVPAYPAQVGGPGP